MPHRLCAIPLDNRPVCYTFPQLLAEVAGIELCLPAENLLSGRNGQLKEPANEPALKRWLNTYLGETSAVLVALDTIVYGGLIPSRLGSESLEETQAHLDAFFEATRHKPVYGFSSVLRIPNDDNDDEEPAYWATYGTDLYDYSATLHRSGQVPTEIVGRLPENVLVDFHRRRERNFGVNQSLLGRLANHQLKTLVFSQDDTGPYGLNVQEAEALHELIAERGLANHAWVKTGADEVLLSLLVRWCYETKPVPTSAGNQSPPISIFPVYSHPKTREALAQYDGLPIDALVSQQIRASGAVVAEAQSTADLILWVHTPPAPESDELLTAQLDHCRWPDKLFPQKAADYQILVEDLECRVEAGQNVMIADLAYANGGDPMLTDALMLSQTPFTELYGYAGWNTPGNTLGSVLAMGMLRHWSETHQCFNGHAFNQAMLTRFADDALYQGQVRQTMKHRFGDTNVTLPDVAHLNARMSDDIAMLKNRLDLPNASVHCYWPCYRWFEIGVEIDGNDS